MPKTKKEWTNEILGTLLLALIIGLATAAIRALIGS